MRDRCLGQTGLRELSMSETEAQGNAAKGGCQEMTASRARRRPATWVKEHQRSEITEFGGSRVVSNIGFEVQV